MPVPVKSVPARTRFGFVLVIGDSHAVSSLKKREDEPEKDAYTLLRLNLDRIDVMNVMTMNSLSHLGCSMTYIEDKCNDALDTIKQCNPNGSYAHMISGGRYRYLASPPSI